MKVYWLSRALPARSTGSAGAGIVAPRSVVNGALAHPRVYVYVSIDHLFYDLKHDTSCPSLSRTLSYFFLLPNVCFPLFLIADYKTPTSEFEIERPHIRRLILFPSPTPGRHGFARKAGSCISP